MKSSNSARVRIATLISAVVAASLLSGLLPSASIAAESGSAEQSASPPKEQTPASTCRTPVAAMTYYYEVIGPYAASVPIRTSAFLSTL